MDKWILTIRNQTVHVPKLLSVEDRGQTDRVSILHFANPNFNRDFGLPPPGCFAPLPFTSAPVSLSFPTASTGGWWRNTVVERRSLTGELSLSVLRSTTNVGKPTGQPTRPIQPFILSGSINE